MEPVVVMLHIIQALRKQRQGDSLNLKPAGFLQFQDSLDYRMRPHLKKKSPKMVTFMLCVNPHRVLFEFMITLSSVTHVC